MELLDSKLPHRQFGQKESQPLSAEALRPELLQCKRINGFLPAFRRSQANFQVERRDGQGVHLHPGLPVSVNSFSFPCSLYPFNIALSSHASIGETTRLQELIN